MQVNKFKENVYKKKVYNIVKLKMFELTIFCKFFDHINIASASIIASYCVKISKTIHRSNKKLSYLCYVDVYQSVRI